MTTDHSYTDQANIPCPYCGNAVLVDVWLIADTSAHPELAAHLELGTLNTVTCSRCGSKFVTEGPLLVFRPDENPVLVFSPAIHLPDNAARVHRQRLLAILRESSGNDWQESWQTDLREVPRALLPIALFGGDAQLHFSTSLQRSAALRQALEVANLLSPSVEGANGLVQLRKALNDHPVLLSSAVDLLLSQWEKADWLESKDRQIVARRRILLRQCRQAGIDAAFERLVHEVSSPDGLQQPSSEVLDAVISLLKSPNWDETRRIIELQHHVLFSDQAELVFDRLAEHFAGDPLNAGRIEQDRALVNRCRRHGVGAGLAEHQQLERLLAQLNDRTHPMTESDRVAALQEALALTERSEQVVQWAELSLDFALSLLAGARDAAEDLEQTIGLFRDILQVVTLALPEYWSTIHTNLAEAWRRRTVGERAENLDYAYAHARLALLSLDQQSSSDHRRAMIHSNLGLILMDRGRLEDPARFKICVAHLERALQLISPEANPELWATVQTNLGEAYASSKVEGNLYEAISYYRAALSILDSGTDPTSWAFIHWRLGRAYEAQTRGPGEKGGQQALEHYQQALEVSTLDVGVGQRLTILRDLGRFCFVVGRWQEALTAFLEALQLGDTLFDEAYSQTGRRAAIGKTDGLCAQAAFCCLRLGMPGKALELLERGKTRLLNADLVLSDAGISALSAERQHALREAQNKVNYLQSRLGFFSSDRGALPDWRLSGDLAHADAELQRILRSVRAEEPGLLPVYLDLPRILACVPPEGVLVAPLSTRRGTAVIVLPHGTEAVTEDHVLWPEAGDEYLAQSMLVGNQIQPGWMFAYARRVDGGALEDWQAAVETITGRLWESLMGAVHHRLQALGIGPGAPVILAPQGGLGLLPLHAAWRREGGTLRYFLDDYTVTFIPSAFMLAVTRQRLQVGHGDPPSLLAVTNPTGDLPFSAIEGELVSSVFPAEVSHVLRGKLREEFLSFVSQAPHSAYLHFACHGSYDPLDPAKSTLYLGGMIPFSVPEILTFLRLEHTRLVCLSACETGMAQYFDVPDEYTGMASAFLQVGAAAVVSSLWAVDDISTSLLMNEFYRRHLTAGQGIAEALRGAQLWLRDLTRDQVLDLIEPVRERVQSDDPSLYKAVDGLYWHLLEDFGETDCPYLHPYYWGAFTASGAVF